VKEAATKFQVGKIVWRGFRYWNDLDLTLSGLGGYVGWNTTFIPYRILAVTEQRIKIGLLTDSINGTDATEKDRKPLFLDRGKMERQGKQYHTRFHEWFYAAKPATDPEQRGSQGNAISVLNLPTFYTKDDVRRAYKRLARIAHPDNGGSNAAFIELKRAHDEALRSTYD
jgi:hypothetical protein